MRLLLALRILAALALPAAVLLPIPWAEHWQCTMAWHGADRATGMETASQLMREGEDFPLQVATAGVVLFLLTLPEWRRRPAPLWLALATALGATGLGGLQTVGAAFFDLLGPCFFSSTGHKSSTGVQVTLAAAAISTLGALLTAGLRVGEAWRARHTRVAAREAEKHRPVT